LGKASLYRYIREHYRKVQIRKDHYDRLKRIGEELRMPMSEVIKMFLDMYEKGLCEKGESG